MSFDYLFIKKNAMKRIIYFLLMFGFFGFFLISCQRDKLPSNTTNPIIPKASKDLVVSPNFKFSTVKNLPVSITALDNQNKPLSNVRFNILTDYKANGGKAILTASTDENGSINLTYTFPDYLDSVVVATDFLGLPNETKVSAKSGQILLKLGGPYPVTKSASAGPWYKSTSASNIKNPLGTWDSSGVPNYLVSPNEVIDASFLNDINTLLPESVDLRKKHPELLNNANQSDLVLIDTCDVWVTFVSEGAGFLNSLGYYYYNTDNPPKTVADLGDLNIIFPNCSFPGSGGNLHSGNKVKLKGPGPNGSFPKNTTVGWVLFANGYSGNQVTPGNWTLYSDWKLNPEADDNLKKHFLFLYDRARYRFLLTVEDWRRDQSSCDQDFNDCLFYVTANPIQNINTDNIPPVVYQGSDADGDGVPDNFDNYPNDPTKAYDSYYPAKGVFGSVAFEDLWPYTGDYDLNDMVIDCNFDQVTNAKNMVVEIDGQLSLRAMGATFKNGFGFQLPFAPSAVASCKVTSKKTGLPISLSNIVNIDPVTGLEAGQDKAVVILSDNGFNLLPPNGSGIGANTTPGVPWVNPDTLLVKITFKTPLPVSSVGSAPYNQFIFVNGDRSREVHLPDQAPTALANSAFFGTGSDDSNPATGRYYRTKNNMPWAISFADHYDYPVEKADIITAHLHFAEWAISSGTVFKDWYLNKTGYRNSTLIYQKP
jgi:LruC domain-containing protein